jgi:hypothetical protein
VCVSSKTASKLLHLYPHKRSVVHKHYDTAHEVRLDFVNWFLHGMLDGKMDPTLILFSNEACFLLGECVNSQ